MSFYRRSWIPWDLHGLHTDWWFWLSSIVFGLSVGLTIGWLVSRLVAR